MIGWCAYLRGVGVRHGSGEEEHEGEGQHCILQPQSPCEGSARVHPILIDSMIDSMIDSIE